jgi:1,4-alpha-glucan branching enzyme
MSLKKQLLKSKPICKVTFRISKDAAKNAKEIHVAGDFNNWSETETPLRALKSGEFTAMVEVSNDKAEYQFRYIYDGTTWENDWHADDYIDNGYGVDNSVLRL